MNDDFFDCVTENRKQAPEKDLGPRSLVKWAGGKGMLLSSIVPSFISRDMLRDGNSYIEPFSGSCAMAFHLKFKKMILNDKNIKLMNFYEQVKCRPEKLVRKINLLIKDGVSYGDREKFYYKIRSEYNELCLVKGNGITHASMFWFLNKTCFNGMYRETKYGAFNIPFGKRDCPIPDVDDFVYISNILKNCKIYHKPFEKICDMAKEHDIVYLDPPYIPISKTSSFSSYLRYGFDDSDHKRLCKMMQKMSDDNVYVIMSNSNSEETKSIYGSLSGFQIFEIDAPRLISGKSKGRGMVKEIIVTNKDTVK